MRQCHPGPRDVESLGLRMQNGKCSPARLGPTAWHAVLLQGSTSASLVPGTHVPDYYVTSRSNIRAGSYLYHVGTWQERVWSMALCHIQASLLGLWGKSCSLYYQEAKIIPRNKTNRIHRNSISFCQYCCSTLRDTFLLLNSQCFLNEFILALLIKHGSYYRETKPKNSYGSKPEHLSSVSDYVKLWINSAILSGFKLAK